MTDQPMIADTHTYEDKESVWEKKYRISTNVFIHLFGYVIHIYLLQLLGSSI